MAMNKEVVCAAPGFTFIEIYHNGFILYIRFVRHIIRRVPYINYKSKRFLFVAGEIVRFTVESRMAIVRG